MPTNKYTNMIPPQLMQIIKTHQLASMKRKQNLTFIPHTLDPHLLCLYRHLQCLWSD